MDFINMGLVGQKPHAARGVVIIDGVGGIISQVFIKFDRVITQQQSQLIESHTGTLRATMPTGAAGQLITLQ